MRKPFSAAVDLYRSLKNQTNELICQVLQLGPQDILALNSCPACFGPRPSNFNDYPQTTSNQLIICLDGNFQHRHHVKASRDYRPLQTPRIFLKPKEFTQAANWIRAKEIELSPPSKVCHFRFLFSRQKTDIKYVLSRLIGVRIHTKPQTISEMNLHGKVATILDSWGAAVVTTLQSTWGTYTSLASNDVCQLQS